MTSSSTLPALPLCFAGDLQLYVPPSLAVITTYVLLEQEAWFEDEVNFVRQYLRPGEMAVDVGANFGVYTIVMAEAVGPAGKVLAFEPSARTAAYLRASALLKHGTQVEVIQAAASDHVGQGQLHVGTTPELSSLGAATAVSKATETVSLITLDEQIALSDASRITLIKLDAEGHELQVGHGARRLLTQHEPLVLFEIKHGATFEFGFLEFLESLGWAGYRLVPGMNMLVPFKRDGAIDSRQLNLFGCSRQKAGELQRRGLLSDPSAAPLTSNAAPLDPRPALFSFGDYPGSDTAYGLALAHFATAQHGHLDADRRMAHMWHAFQQAQQAYTAKGTLARRVTLARIAADLGHRSAAVSLLGGAVAPLTSAEFDTPDEPCLCPERSAVHEPSKECFRIAVLEAFERQRTFSSMFLDLKSLPLIEHICRHPLSSAEMHRRRQLVRLTRGLQAKVEPHPKLVEKSPGNLNTHFWGS